MKIDYDKVYEYWVENIDMGGGDGEYLTEKFLEDYPEYDPDQTVKFEKFDEKLFDKWLKERMSDKEMADSFYRIYDDIRYELTDNGLPIWREIYAPKTWKPTDKNIGIFWSWDKNSAKAHWGSYDGKGVEWLIESIAQKNQIDWELTIALNAHPSLGDDEREIRLIEGSEVPILSLERDGKKISTKQYEGQLFRANPGK